MELAIPTISGTTLLISVSICLVAMEKSPSMSSAIRIIYPFIAKIPSVPGASTSFFVPELNWLYVPATPYAGQPAAVQVFEVQP